MLLTDIGKTPQSVLRKINVFLKENYGLQITPSISKDKVMAITEQLKSEIDSLKMAGQDAHSSSEISQRLLILEGLQSLREFFNENEIRSPEFNRVVDILVDFVNEEYRLSGVTHEDLEECIKDAMKHYRSSKYRFPDEMVESAIREKCPINVAGVMEATTDRDPFQMHKDLDDFQDTEIDPDRVGDLKLVDPAGEDEPRLVRDKNGNLVPDPFDAYRLARKKGVRPNEQNFMEEKDMKENLVKNLRRLLETEVSQAEVMMAAKGFAQELQEMVEKIGRLQNEDLPPVTDQMRETYGTQSSSAFQTQIYGALQGVMDALYTAKNQVDDAVTTMAETGQVGAQIDMDKDVGDLDNLDDTEAGMSGDEDLDNLDVDDFGAAEEEEPLGREMKAESVENLRRKVTEMRKLVERARKLRESRQ